MLMHIISNSNELGYLALINLGLLMKIEDFKEKLLDRNIKYGIIDTFIKAIRNF